MYMKHKIIGRIYGGENRKQTNYETWEKTEKI